MGSKDFFYRFYGSYYCGGKVSHCPPRPSSLREGLRLSAIHSAATSFPGSPFPVTRGQCIVAYCPVVLCHTTLFTTRRPEILNNYTLSLTAFALPPSVAPFFYTLLTAVLRGQVILHVFFSKAAVKRMGLEPFSKSHLRNWSVKPDLLLKLLQ